MSYSRKKAQEFFVGYNQASPARPIHDRRSYRIGWTALASAISGALEGGRVSIARGVNPEMVKDVLLGQIRDLVGAETVEERTAWTEEPELLS